MELFTIYYKRNRKFIRRDEMRRKAQKLGIICQRVILSIFHAFVAGNCYSGNPGLVIKKKGWWGENTK